MKLYYWNARKNFGDLLTPLLLKKFSKLDSEWSKPENAELVMVGSILEHLPLCYKGIIAGSGKLHEDSKLSFPNAKILGLRGWLTYKAIRPKKEVVIGDPALLADELVPLHDKIYQLGIVPHWTDTTLEKDPRFTKYKPVIIRSNEDPLKIISEIGKCRKIITSSLHGLVLADAFGIPRRIEIAPKMINNIKQEGGLFKFNDYLSSLNMELKIGVTQEVDRHKIADRQHELYDMFDEIKDIFK